MATTHAQKLKLTSNIKKCEKLELHDNRTDVRPQMVDNSLCHSCLTSVGNHNVRKWCLGNSIFGNLAHFPDFHILISSSRWFPDLDMRRSLGVICSNQQIFDLNNFQPDSPSSIRSNQKLGSIRSNQKCFDLNNFRLFFVSADSHLTYPKAFDSNHPGQKNGYSKYSQDSQNVGSTPRLSQCILHGQNIKAKLPNQDSRVRISQLLSIFEKL